MAYTKLNWEDSPSTNTPINAQNLNHMDQGIFDVNNNLLLKQNLLTGRTLGASDNVLDMSLRAGSYWCNNCINSPEQSGMLQVFQPAESDGRALLFFGVSGAVWRTIHFDGAWKYAWASLL